MFSPISLPVPSQQMTMFFMGEGPAVAGERLATGGRNSHVEAASCNGGGGKGLTQICCVSKRGV